MNCFQFGVAVPSGAKLFAISDCGLTSEKVELFYFRKARLETPQKTVTVLPQILPLEKYRNTTPRKSYALRVLDRIYTQKVE